MTDTANDVFDHPFGGWDKQPARRWKNPDGSQGGIVATSATVDIGVRLPVDVIVGPRASIGDGASIGPRASKGTDERSLTLGA